MKKGLIILLVVVGLIAILFGKFGGIYNNLVKGDEGVKSAWSQVENVYQRRADLIPNLVETVKGYATHEEKTLTEVIQARATATQMTLSPDIVNNPDMLTKFQQNQGALSSALGRLMAVAEQYPNLKANESFLALQSQLEGTENRVTVERMRFNEAAQSFNTYRRSFPNNIIANMMGFGEKAYFKADEGTNKAPTVKFVK